MSPRPRTTFAKRQKEQARKEKQRAKAQRRLERKSEGQTRLPGPDEAAHADSGVPVQTDSQPDTPSEFPTNGRLNSDL